MMNCRAHGSASIAVLCLLGAAGNAGAQEKTPVSNIPAPLQQAPSTALSAPPSAPAPSPPSDKWYDRIELLGFVDAYLSINYHTPKPQGGVNRFRAYDPNNGFSLAWAGIDLSLAPDPVGVTIQLRFGPSVPNLALADFNLPGGIGQMQNAYVSWKPQGKDGNVTLILGKFDTLYGAEVAQSHLNVNYSRGVLYNLGQPFFHTGLRADIQVNQVFGAKLMAVNGWNNTLDNNTMKSFGSQFSFAFSDKLNTLVGYIGGPEQDDVTTLACAQNTTPNKITRACDPNQGTPPSSLRVAIPGANTRWRHLVDLVVNYKPTDKLAFSLNGDYAIEDLERGRQQWYGAALSMRYGFKDWLGAAFRTEYLVDTDGYLTGYPNGHIQTNTLTLDVIPNEHLVIRLENRLDTMNRKAFQDGVDGSTMSQYTTTLGVVGKTK